MTPDQLEALISPLPRKHMLFLPTPFVRMDNLSAKRNVNLFIKRDDMVGPLNLSGNKARKLEFIIGKAKQEGITHLISTGAYQTNAGTQLASCCNKAGLKSILYLSDRHDEGADIEYSGNLLLSKIMGCEVHFVSKADRKTPGEQYARCLEFAEQRKAELAAEGFKAKIYPAGLCSEDSFVAYVDAFLELHRQWEAMSEEPLDYIFMSSGTGGTLPGIIAGKLLLNSPVKIINISVDATPLYSDDDMIHNVLATFAQLKVAPPSRQEIQDCIHNDFGFGGAGYGKPTQEAAAAIREVAENEGILMDPIYTGKVMSGVLDYIETGKVDATDNALFMHTGGIGSLFMGESFNKEIWDSFEASDYL